MDWIAVGTVAVSVGAGLVLVVVLQRLERRSSFAVGDRVRVVGAGLTAGRTGTIEDGGDVRFPTGAWMVRFDGAPSTVSVRESALQHLPMTEFPDAKKPPSKWASGSGPRWGSNSRTTDR